jgi:hypothetical protein
MIRVNGAQFHEATVALREFEAISSQIRLDPTFDWKEKIESEDYKKVFIEPSLALKKYMEIIGAKFSIMSIDAFCLELHSGNCTQGKMDEYIKDINKRVRDELKQIEFLIIDGKYSDLYEAKEPVFGLLFDLRFSSVTYEIEEAAKCLALDRSTASAFHSIRCLEAGIRAISRCLGIPDPTRGADRTWFKILRAIKDEIDKRWPTSIMRHGGDPEFFDNAYAALAALQNPWRNSTMHLDQNYTLDDAKHVFDVVQGFMKKIASRMDEEGMPKA